MSFELLTYSLDLIRQQTVVSPVFSNYFSDVKAQLLASEEAIIALTVMIGQEEEEDTSPLILLSLLLDEARMGLENDGARASGFLAAVERAIETGLSSGVLEQQHLLRFAGLYQQAGLPVPDGLKIDPDKMVRPEGAETFDLSENLQAMARDIQSDGGNAYDLFSVLSEMTAAMPDEVRASFANHLAMLPGALFERCALYFILSGSSPVPEAALAGLFERLSQSGLKTETENFLPIIRGWLGPGDVRTALDELIRQARRKGQGAQQAGRASFQTLEMVGTVTDGVGAQSISVAIENDGAFYVALVLTKDGYGVKDAFVVPCASRSDTADLVMRSRIEANAAPICPATLKVLLEGALADGVENGCLPAAGILDVMETCRLLDLRPQILTLQRLLELADPEGRIQNASPQSLGRWINHPVALSLLAPLTDSWFEDTEETRRILATGRTARGVETRIWKYLDGRRDLWARRFLQTALLLLDAGDADEWQTLTASAYGLMNGRVLRRIPLMEAIVYMTIEAAEAQIW